MPDHLHLLVEGTGRDADLRTFVSAAKQRAAYAAKPWLRGKLWQPGYYDRVLRDNDDAYDCIRYILDNAIRAGLAKGLSEYPFVGGSALTRVGRGFTPRQIADRAVAKDEE